MQAGDADGADARHGDAAGAIHRQLQVGVDGAPDRQDDLVARTDDVVAGHGRERILHRRGDGVLGDQVGAEAPHVAGDRRLQHRALHDSNLLHIALELARLVGLRRDGDTRFRLAVAGGAGLAQLSGRRSGAFRRGRGVVDAREVGAVLRRQVVGRVAFELGMRRRGPDTEGDGDGARGRQQRGEASLRQWRGGQETGHRH